MSDAHQDTYLQVEPSDERYDPAEVIDVVRGLHGLSDADEASEGLISTVYSKVTGQSRPAIEFLALTRGEEHPVELYYGIDGSHLKKLEQTLAELYPESFTITPVKMDLIKELTYPIEFNPSDFLEAVREDDLHADLEIVDEDESEEESADGSTEGFEERFPDLDSGIASVLDTVDGDIRPPRTAPEWDYEICLDDPTITKHDTLLARPSVDSIRPVGVRWHGVGVRKKDWMTQLQQFSDIAAADVDRRIKEEPITRNIPLAGVIEQLNKCPGRLAFQTVFKHKSSWEGGANSREDDLRRRNDTLLNRWTGSFEKKDVDELPLSERNRLTEIEENEPNRSFQATVRAITVEPDMSTKSVSARQREDPAALLEYVNGVFDELNGSFYELQQKRFRSEGLRSKKKEKNANRALERFLNREIYSGSGKSRPDLVLNAEELSSFIALPSTQELTAEGARAVRANSRERNPLPAPDPDVLDSYRSGMTIGLPLDEDGEPREPPVSVPTDKLPKHVARFAATGSGKSIMTMYGTASRHESTDGPTIVMDPKGDGWANEYAQIHYNRFGTLNDLRHIRLPEALPAIPLFDIRPALAAGRDRQTAIQEVKSHFRALARLILEDYDSAAQSNTVLGQLIEALFDKKYGNDAYTLNELFQAAKEMRDNMKIPPVCNDNGDLEESLRSHLDKDENQFDAIMSGITNRLQGIREFPHLSEMLNTIPEWDHANHWYEDGFDFKKLFNDDVVVIFDTGDLTPESRNGVTMLLLSKLWHALQPRRRHKESGDLTQVGFVIEEAAEIVALDIVHEQLLPRGRTFGLALDFIMQFPEQVLHAGPDRQTGERAYNELLNNVGTIITGQNAVNRDLAGVMEGGGLDAGEIQTRLGRLPPGEWIVSLPETEFGDTVPAPFSVRSLPQPPGHPNSSDPVTGSDHQQFTEAFKKATEFSAQEYCVSDSRHLLGGPSSPFSSDGPDDTDIDGGPSYDATPDPDDTAFGLRSPHSEDGLGSESKDSGGDDSDNGPSSSATGSGSLIPGSAPDRPGSPESTVTGDGDSGSKSVTDGGGVTPADAPSPPTENDEGRDTMAGQPSPPNPDSGRSMRDQEVVVQARDRSADHEGQGETAEREEGADSAEAGSANASPSSVEVAGAQERPRSAESQNSNTGSQEGSDSIQEQSGSPDSVEYVLVELFKIDQSALDDGTRQKEQRRVFQNAQERGIEITQRQVSDGLALFRDAQKEDLGLSPRSIAKAVTEDLSLEEVKEYLQPDTSERNQSGTPEQDSPTSGKENGERENASLHKYAKSGGSAESTETQLSQEEIDLLHELLLAMNGDRPNYSMLEEGMKTIVNQYDVDVERLIEDGHLEKHRIPRATVYYSVLEKARNQLDITLKSGAGEGDLGEKTPHIYGVRLAAEWFRTRSDVDRVEEYWEYNDNDYDVAAFDKDGSLKYICEVELESHNKDAVLTDYDKLSDVDARSVWICRNSETATSVLNDLQDGERIDEIGPDGMRSFSDMRESLGDLDAEGCDTIASYSEIKGWTTDE